MFRRMKDALYSNAGVPPAFTLTTNRTSGTTVEAPGFSCAVKHVCSSASSQRNRRAIEKGLHPGSSSRPNGAAVGLPVENSVNTLFPSNSR